jgi:hypothetical protein
MAKRIQLKAIAWLGIFSRLEKNLPKTKGPITANKNKPTS